MRQQTGSSLIPVGAEVLSETIRNLNQNVNNNLIQENACEIDVCEMQDFGHNAPALLC